MERSKSVNEVFREMNLYGFDQQRLKESVLVQAKNLGKPMKQADVLNPQSEYGE